MTEYPSTTIETPIGVIEVTCLEKKLVVQGTVLLDTYSYTIRAEYFPTPDSATTAKLPLRLGWVEIHRGLHGKGTQDSRETILKYITEAVTGLVLENPDVWGRSFYVGWISRTQRDKQMVEKYAQFLHEALERLQSAGPEPPSYTDFTWRSSADVHLQGPLPNPE